MEVVLDQLLAIIELCWRVCAVGGCGLNSCAAGRVCLAVRAAQPAAAGLPLGGLVGAQKLNHCVDWQLAGSSRSDCTKQNVLGCLLLVHLMAS